MAENRYNARGSWLVARGLYRIISFIPRKIFYKILNLSRKNYHNRLIQANKRRLKNKNFSIIAKDCAGTLILHEMGLRFDTPTINLWFTAGDFVKFCADLKYYINQELTEYFEDGKNYPIGTLGSGDKKIIIYFMHYKTFSQAKSKWDERKTRIHWDNLYFIMTDGEGCNDKIAKEFDSLTCKNKALLTYRNLEGIKSAVRLDIDSPLEGGNLFFYKSRYSLKRVMDDWDYIKFLNS